jgi:uncharacterized lipoprotein YajG
MQKLIPPAALLLLTGCANIAETVNPKLVCEQWRPVSISKNDKLTTQTATEIAGNNAAQEVYCGKSQRVASR